jgi:hypothetical protein
MRWLCQHLLGDAIGLLLIHIAWFADPKFRLQSQLLRAARCAFTGETGRSRTARALALQDQVRARGLLRFSCNGLHGSRTTHREIPLAIAHCGAMVRALRRR